MPDTAATPRLADLTTLRLGGPARTYLAVEDDDALVAVLAQADADGEPVLVIGGGSNLVVGDDGFDGTVVHVLTRGVEVVDDGCGVVEVTVAAGEPWDAVVARAVEEGWVGIEALAGIPGSTGATPVQNVGAYGQEVASTIGRVRVWDRVRGEQHTFTAAECAFGYRHSRFKAERLDAWGGRYVVLDVTFEFHPGTLSAPIAYSELARTLGVEVEERAPSAQVREAVLGLRRGKAMVLDAHDHDTWSAGSFFTNPFVDAADLPSGAPSYPQGDGTTKTSAAWLIEHAGFSRGFGLDRPGARVSLSTRHTLALTNRGGARTDDLLALAREVRDGVHARFGIALVPEPVLVGCSL